MKLIDMKLPSGPLQLSVSDTAPFTLSLSFGLSDGIECCMEGTTKLMSDVPRLMRAMERNAAALGADREAETLRRAPDILSRCLATRV